MNEARPLSSRRDLLRRSTHRYHVELDAFAGALDLTTPQDYGRFLVANGAPVAALELALEAANVGELLSDWNSRARRHALDADLADLNLTRPALQAPSLESRGAQWGVLYVLEGSRLGAQVLLRRVLAATDESVHSATRFLRSNEPKHWGSFLQALESAKDIDLNQLTLAACEAFALFQSSFAALATARSNDANAPREQGRLQPN